MSSGYPDFYRLIEFGAQRIGVAIKGEWEVMQGRELTLIGTAFSLAGGTSKLVINRTTPTGRQFYVTDLHLMCRGPDFPPGMYHLYKDGLLLMAASSSSGAPSIHPPLMVPFRFDEGKALRAYVWNDGAVTADFYFTVHGYEVPV